MMRPKDVSSSYKNNGRGLINFVSWSFLLTYLDLLREICALTATFDFLKVLNFDTF